MLVFAVYLIAAPKHIPDGDLYQWSGGFTTPINHPKFAQPLMHNPLRSWRLRQTVEANIIGGIPDYTADYYYNSIQTDKLDSILVSVRNEGSLDWMPSLKMQYIYDLNTGNLINHSWYDLSTDIPFIYLNLDFVYNQDNLCTDGYQTIYYEDVQALIPVKRLHVFYGNDDINCLYWWAYNHTYDVTYYSCSTFTYDTWGRPSVINEQISSDSLSWENSYRSTIQYHSSDSSNSADFVNYYAHPGNPFPSLFQPLSSPAWGVLDNVQSDYWNGTDWVLYDKKSYCYSANNMLNAVVDMFYSDGWQNEHIYLQTFDNNSLPYYLAAREWYDYFHTWDSPYRQTYFYWSQITGLQDDHIPLPNLKLSVSPNPFTDQVSFSLVSKDSTPARISVFNLKGQLVRSFDLINGKTIAWNGSDEKGNPTATGIYLISVKQGSAQVTGKLVRLLTP